MALGDELRALGGDVAAVIARADERAMELMAQAEMHKARADAAVINAEQTCSLLEQKFVALMQQTAMQESEKSQVSMLLESKSAELAQAHSQANQLELQLIKLRTEVETRDFELKEVHASKKELLDAVAMKNTELAEKNTSISTYLDKVLALTEEKSNLESRILENTTVLVQARAREARMEQEKDITAQHNAWLNQDLSSKVALLLEERQRTTDLEAELQQKTAEIERITKDKEETLRRSQDHLKELETDLQKRTAELNFVTEDAAAKEELLSNESATASKLVELYKKSSEEWSKKSSDLEGVIKALEMHLTEVRDDYEEKIRKEVEARQTLEKQAANDKDELEKKISELQKSKAGGYELMELDARDMAVVDTSGNEIAMPSLPIELSSTALAASLIRDGWTVGKLYRKYQEAVDALRHEKQERSYCQSLLNRVLREIEEKAELILEERAEYKRMVEAYKVMEENLKFSVSDQATLEMTVRDLKAELRKKERDVKNASKDVSDLQNQVSVLLKECSDIQKRYGIGEISENEALVMVSSVPDSSPSDAVISEKLMTFKDIQELVEHNTKIRSLLRFLANENEEKEKRLKESFDFELKKHIDDASHKVNSVLQKAEEQELMIESLRGTIGIYKRLYEDEKSVRSSLPLKAGPDPSKLGHEEHDIRRLMDMAQEETRQELKKATEQIASLEEEVTKTRHEICVARAECSRSRAEASFAKDQLASSTRELEQQRKQMESILLRNMELSQTILDFQRRLKESSQNVQAADEQARRHSVDVIVLEREKTLLANAEKEARSEASQLSDRVHRLQAKLATIENAEEVREMSRASERKKLEDDINRLQRDWVEAKHQLELERNHVSTLASQRDKAIGQATERVEALTLELKGATARVSNFEMRAKVAEARCAELESSLKKADEKVMVLLSGGKRLSVSDDTNVQMQEQSREEVNVLKEELAAVKAHSEQYKAIAMANEEALRQLEEAHRRLKAESTSTRNELDSELKMLHKQLSDVETHTLEKEKEAGAAQANRESLLRDALKELASLKDADAATQSQLEQYEERIKLLGEELEKQRNQWRAAQNNYERQVLLQADTIRELDAASERLKKLESQEKQLTETAAKAEAELESVNVLFYMEKDAWAGKQAAMENRIKELDLQNSLLLDRLEARHLNLAEQERKAAGGESSSGETKEESELHVIGYVRRAKEAADAEISLLTQERNRYKALSEAGSKAAEEAQDRLRQHLEKTQASLFSEEEFRALQAQMMELHLLRESNAQLKEESKKASEDAAEIRTRLSQLEDQHDSWKKTLREKELELESAKSEIEFLKSEVQRWQQRVSQILEKYKALDVDDYERVKLVLVEYEERLKKYQVEIEELRKKAQDELETYRNECATLQQKLTEMGDSRDESNRKLQEAEATAKVETDKAKRYATNYKRKLEADLARKVEAELAKRVDEYKANIEKSFEAKHQEAIEAAHKEVAARSEQAQKETVARYEQVQKEVDLRLKEKETRIQILEKTLEKEREELKKEREELRKERLRRDKDRKTYMEMAKNLKQEKQDNGQRQQVPIIASTSEMPSTTVVPEQAETASRLQNDAEPPAQPTLTEVTTIQQIAPAPKPTQVPSSRRPALDPEKDREMQELRASIYEKEKNQARKPGRPRIIRPRIDTGAQPDVASEGPEPHLDEIEMNTDTGSMDIIASVSLKRSASETVSGEPMQHEAKKPRATDAFEHEGEAEQLKLREKSPEPPLAADDVTETLPDADIVEGEEAFELPPNETQGEDDTLVVDEQREQVPAEVINEASPMDTGFMEAGEGSEYPEDGEISVGAVEEEPAEGEVAEQEQTGGDREEQEGDAETNDIVDELEGAKMEGEVVEEQLQQPEHQQQHQQQVQQQQQQHQQQHQQQQQQVQQQQQQQQAQQPDTSTGETTEGDKEVEKSVTETTPLPSTTISLAERARERSALRRPPPPPASSPPTLPMTRGRGRASNSRRRGAGRGGANNSPARGGGVNQ